MGKFYTITMISRHAPNIFGQIRTVGYRLAPFILALAAACSRGEGYPSQYSSETQIPRASSTVTIPNAPTDLRIEEVYDSTLPAAPTDLKIEEVYDSPPAAPTDLRVYDSDELTPSATSTGLTVQAIDCKYITPNPRPNRNTCVEDWRLLEEGTLLVRFRRNTQNGVPEEYYVVRNGAIISSNETKQDKLYYNNRLGIFVANPEQSRELNSDQRLLREVNDAISNFINIPQ